MECLYLFFFLGVRARVLLLEEVVSQLLLASEAHDPSVSTHFILLAFSTQDGLKSRGVSPGLQDCQTRSHPCRIP